MWVFLFVVFVIFGLNGLLKESYVDEDGDYYYGYDFYYLDEEYLEFKELMLIFS